MRRAASSPRCPAFTPSLEAASLQWLTTPVSRLRPSETRAVMQDPAKLAVAAGQTISERLQVSGAAIAASKTRASKPAVRKRGHVLLADAGKSPGPKRCNWDGRGGSRRTDNYR